MNVAQFIEAFRHDLQDKAEPPLWSDAEIVRFLNDAVQEANERALLTEDRTTPAVCTIATQIGVSSYPLHPSVLKISRATLNGCRLTETSQEEQDCLGPSDWETRDGRASGYIFDQAAGLAPSSIRLTRLPTEAGSIQLTVYRGALQQLSPDRENEAPEIPARFHERLKDWVYRCAYLKQDVDAMDMAKAADYDALFTASFGIRLDANVQRKHRDKRPPLVRSSW